MDLFMLVLVNVVLFGVEFFSFKFSFETMDIFFRLLIMLNKYVP